MPAIQLLPAPREIQLTEKWVRLSSAWRIAVASGAPDDRYAAELINAELRANCGWTLPVVTEPAVEDCIALVRREAAAAPPLYETQGYDLSIDSRRVQIAAPGATGRFYGAQTLRQIIRQCPDANLPQLKIRDWPALEWRGVSDDISRGQVSTLEHFRRIIRDLAYYKLNLYQPYIEDMFRFEFEPAIGADRGALTAEEMRALTAAAKQNHVQLIPILNCLGHQERLLAIPHLRKFAEIKNPTPELPLRSFCAADPAARAFVKQMIDELAAATDAPYFHIGGDESWDVGRGGSKQAVEQKGAARVHAEYFAELIAHLKTQHGRAAMLYADVLLEHPHTLELLPRECVFIDWQYRLDSDYPSLALLKSRGLEKILISPGLWNWNTFYPNYARAFANIAATAAAARHERILGLVVSSWGDNGAENLRDNNWPGYAFAAACCWEPGKLQITNSELQHTDHTLRTVVDGRKSEGAAPAEHKVDEASLPRPKNAGMLLPHTREGAAPAEPLPADAPQAAQIDLFLRRFVAVHYGSHDPELAEAHRLTGWVEYLEEKFPGSWIHQYPRLGRNLDFECRKIAQLFEHSSRALEILAAHPAATGNIRHNADQLALLAHAARRYRFIARRERYFSAHRHDPETRQALATELETIRNEFAALWLRANKRPLLDFNLKRLEEQLAALKKIGD